MVKPSIKRFAIETNRKPASETQVRKIENQLCLSIPTEFRDFLLVNDGGIPSKSEIVYGEEPYQDARLKYFYSIEGPPRHTLEYAIQEYAARIPVNTFPIASDEGDNLIVMDTNDGKVYFWDHELECSSQPIVFVADSLRNFLKMLKEDKDPRYTIAVVEFMDGSTVRRVLPSNTFSKTRNAVVAIDCTKVGEVIEEFGIEKVVKNVNTLSETGPRKH